MTETNEPLDVLPFGSIAYDSEGVQRELFVNDERQLFMVVNGYRWYAIALTEWLDVLDDAEETHGPLVIKL